ncbi:N-acetylglucosamine-6-phosphate deacetylase [Cellulomonas denverensis]|uniref:Amidohydrolase family protein n=1 Tax=Cellulomonas denverensis TaxID=264297 RepID=A0A7X6R0C8_9CELL|nr:amidohydrolase family protein [Cellulomonas denverensis]NKY24070.1 amidohydrolase family protein [Cellulomonas denverensis]GIG26519.1 N-acetylglucosamine-6-phosphate deacetylase [Cellulomonas denverensis]
MSTYRTDAPTLLRGEVVTPTQIEPDGVVVLSGDRIAWVGPVEQLPAEWRDELPAEPAPGTTVLPGLIDIHDHGGGGESFPDATTADQARTAAREHLRHGTTGLVASLVTAPREVLLARAALLADLVDAGELIGIHSEGPFLSADRCGAQNPGDMLGGDPVLVAELAAAARGHLVTMTIAPEVPGVADGGPGRPDAMSALVQAGALPSIGHTDAHAPTVEAAVQRGRALLAGGERAEAVGGGLLPGRSPRLTATHLFNGMRPLHHRDPGPIAACLAAAARGELVVELVADGTHLDPATVRSIFDLVGAESIMLVTDAMAAAGMPDGDYRLGPMAVRVGEGVARLIADDGSSGAIAGGTAHLLDVVRATVAAGVPMVAAVRSAATTPAHVLGREDLGALVAGRRADVLVTDHELAPVAVYRAGVLIED